MTFLDQNSFATLASPTDLDLVATHLPLLFDESRGPRGALLGHLAHANSHWRSAANGRVLAIFQGPHAYISPTWYETPGMVPTWNYVAVHVYGTLRLIEDRTQKQKLLERMVERYESSQPVPWRIDTEDEAALNRKLDGIVGCEIEIDRIEGKWKLNQNHPRELRENVIRHLSETDDPDAHQIANLMKDTLDKPSAL